MEHEIVQLARLTPHPDFERLFLPLEGPERESLKRAMAEGARFQPLLIDRNGRILAGVEHWRAALALGWRRISAVRAPALSRSETLALMMAENVATNEVREEHLGRGMNNFFDMQPLRPPGGW